MIKLCFYGFQLFKESNHTTNRMAQSDYFRCMCFASQWKFMLICCMSFCAVYMRAYALECVLWVFISVCPHFSLWAHGVHLHAVMTAVCVWVCACVLKCVYVCVCEGERGRVPRQNNEGKWIPDGLFFLFSLCCQWREESDKLLMGNRLARSGFELCQHHRAAELSLSPPWDSTALLTTIALRNSCLFEVHAQHGAAIRADETIWLCQADLQLLQQRNNSLLSALFEPLSHVNDYFRFEH